MTEKQVRDLLRQECKRIGSQRKAATAMGVSYSLISYILAGKREPAGRVLEALGVERVVSYRRVKEAGDE